MKDDSLEKEKSLEELQIRNYPVEAEVNRLNNNNNNRKIKNLKLPTMSSLDEFSANPQVSWLALRI